jgi:hypothetical protein
VQAGSTKSGANAKNGKPLNPTSFFGLSTGDAAKKAHLAGPSERKKAANRPTPSILESFLAAKARGRF